jgi:hypothetical protein
MVDNIACPAVATIPVGGDMTVSRLFAERFTSGLTVGLGALVIGTGLRTAGAPAVPIYWGMFVASMFGTLLALGVGNAFSLRIRRSEAHGDSSDASCS